MNRISFISGVRAPVAAALAMLVAAACSSGSDNAAAPTPVCSPTSVAITGTATATAGGTTNLTGTVSGANCAAAAIVWTSSDTSVLTVSNTGVVTAKTAGKADITATSGTQSSTQSVTSTFPAATADARYAYMWAYGPSTPSYSNNGGYDFSTSGAINIVRASAGTYSVTFVGLAAAAGQHENMQVVAYGSNARCQLASWAATGADIVAQVRCASPAGVATDSYFNIFTTGATALAGRVGFAVNTVTANSGYWAPMATTYTSSHGGVRISRSGTGVYNVTMVGMARTGTQPETIQITSMGSAGEYCNVSSWGTSGADLSIGVVCYAVGGAAADSKFSVLMYDTGRTGHGSGFFWADNATAANSTPNAGYSFNSALGLNALVRSGAGQYSATFGSILRLGSDRETMLLNAYGTGGGYCTVGGWSYPSSSVNVLCYDATGAAVDSRFVLSWIQ